MADTTVEIWTEIVCAYCGSIGKAPKGSHFCSDECLDAYAARLELDPSQASQHAQGALEQKRIDSGDVEPGEVFHVDGGFWVASQFITGNDRMSIWWCHEHIPKGDA